jgi:CheY-like chemotaxis protein
MESSRDFRYDTVLIIDDSQIDVLVNRRLVELTRFARQVVLASTGEEGLRYLREDCHTQADVPSWIFLDMHLPGISGFEFVEAFRDFPEAIRSKTRIVLLSVFHQPAQMKAMLQYDFVHGTLEKPLTQKALLELAGTGITSASS